MQVANSISNSAESDNSDEELLLKRPLSKLTSIKGNKPNAFAILGLSDMIIRAVVKKGYKNPTPIQRKSIPIINTGRDVVAMARTGSGKTAAFLLPMLEKLKFHSALGPRALILSPTRELAVQTLTFLRELGKFTNLVAVGILGGDRMDDQFAALHKNPDIIVATPGRLLHIVVEMDLKLKTIEYVVFDEGDRLFELGFSEQLSETLSRLSNNKQTLVFSATLPSNLVDFTKAKLSNPVLIRLDTDCKISEQLHLSYLTCLNDDKPSALLHLVRNVIPQEQQAVIFFATKHHTEYIQSLLEFSKLESAVIHSGLDPTARNLVVANFKARKTRLLLVTDLAARGIDMPFLDNVVNYHFPGQAKLFVHRVGRVARAGRAGTAYSLVDPEEFPHLFDTLMFLSRQLVIPDSSKPFNSISDVIGKYPRVFISQGNEIIATLTTTHAEIEPLAQCSQRAYNKFMKTRPKASTESVKRVKAARAKLDLLPIHPIFLDSGEVSSSEDILNILRNVRVPTIFEALGKTSTNAGSFEMMARKRQLHDEVIKKTKIKKVSESTYLKMDSIFDFSGKNNHKPNNATSTMSSKMNDGENPADLDLDQVQESFFVPYQRPNHNLMEERGLTINPTSNFNIDVGKASLDLINDELVGINSKRSGNKNMLVWDRKKKKFTGVDALEGKANIKKIRTESGAVIPASYKTNKYQDWMKKSKMDLLTNEREPVEQNFSEKKSEFSSSFSAKFGSVIEFLDDSANNQTSAKIKKEHWRPGQKKSKKSNKSLGSFKVLGLMNRREQAVRNRSEKFEKREAKGIRQATVERHFGQVRKPEQILKGRKRKNRIMTKMNRGVQRKHNKSKGKSSVFKKN